jgi:hypothetical protein
LVLFLATADVSQGGTEVERTFTLSALTAAQAAQLHGKRARFCISLDSLPEQDGRYTAYDCVARPGLAAGVWLLPGQEAQDKMTVEARLVIVNHRAAWGFPAQTEYRLKDAVACRP